MGGSIAGEGDRKQLVFPTQRLSQARPLLSPHGVEQL
jgi:hypothetical protein